MDLQYTFKYYRKFDHESVLPSVQYLVVHESDLPSVQYLVVHRLDLIKLHRDPYLPLGRDAEAHVLLHAPQHVGLHHALQLGDLLLRAALG